MIEMTGAKFGRLTVLKRAGKLRNGNITWLCQCECGNRCVVDGYLLRTGGTMSCGCLRRERSRQGLTNNPVTAAQMGNVENLAKTWHPRTDDLRINNQSGVTGVSYDENTHLWLARLYYQGRYVLNQSFTDKTAAVAARQKAEEHYLAVSN